MKWMVLTALLVTTAAGAEDREYCPERPGLNTPACTMGKGRVSVETAFADWTRDDQPDARTDTVLIGDTLVRLGLTGNVEAQVGWTPFGHQRVRDRTTGAIDAANRVGDVTLGLKANYSHPDGDGLSGAVLPYVTLPVGRTPIGAGDWGAGLLLPLTYDLGSDWSLAATPEVDAAVNESGNGRHLAYSGTVGLGYKLSDAVTLTGELQALTDRDPAEHTHQALGALSVAWSASDDLQFDLFGAAGLNHDAPDAEVYAGISRRF